MGVWKCLFLLAICGEGQDYNSDVEPGMCVQGSVKRSREAVALALIVLSSNPT